MKMTDTCVCCGEIVPEGRQVCPICERMSINDYYLKIAETVALRSTCLRRQYGAVLVKNNEIIATGYNGSPRGEANCRDIGFCARQGAEHGEGYERCRSVHAEQNAIISAARSEMIGSTLYLACLQDKPDIEPCSICSRLIKNAGIKEVITKKGIIIV